MTIADEMVPCYETEPVLAWVARHPGPWFALVWAPLLLLAPVVDACLDGQAFRVVFLVLLGGWFAVTVSLPFGPGSRPRQRAEAALVAFTLLCAAYLTIWQSDREFVYPLLAIGAAVAVRRRWGLSLVSSVAITAAVAVGLELGSLDAALLLGFATFLAGTANLLVQYLIGLVADLTRAQERLAQTAVAEERLRFSRDLHDLLGHTLSVVVVKAEAVRRLVRRDPDAAAGHAADIETIGRQALGEVREAVTGYRAVGLADELVRARVALSADDIEVEVSLPAQGLEARVDSLLGWVVREGTTNVLRHSGASRCRIVVTADHGAATVEIADDGRGAPTGEGSGLRGLQERVEGLGGELTAAATHSGFVLTASVPEHALTGGR